MRRYLWKFLTQAYPIWLRWRYGMHIGKNCRIAWSAHLDKSVNPKGIYIGDNVWILREAMILAHDHCRGIIADTHIGDNCVIGVRSIIMPGLTIENQVVIGGVCGNQGYAGKCYSCWQSCKNYKREYTGV